ncbi:UNVERIFIED_CONTAM: hypothetical protein Slati_4044500 [Sesamum latifolium]|uniref:Uncharacterized protein n=1 Tax=Sesamum latifolium TaxID=2727402 RepID=A0AAW2TUN5_9LAMI
MATFLKQDRYFCRIRGSIVFRQIGLLLVEGEFVHQDCFAGFPLAPLGGFQGHVRASPRGPSQGHARASPRGPSQAYQCAPFSPWGHLLVGGRCSRLLIEGRPITRSPAHKRSN